MSRRTDAPARSPRRAALASWIGSALEYYDFAVYGTAAAIVLNRIFFPEDTPAIGILKSMVVVGVAYVVRPFGAMIVGPLGDRYGRRFVLMLTLFLMGALSGVTNEELKSEYVKASQELHSLGKAVELYNVRKIPQYGMVRLGHRVVFFPYSHLKDRPKSRPTFVIDANSELGKCFLRDFDALLENAERSQ